MSDATPKSSESSAKTPAQNGDKLKLWLTLVPALSVILGAIVAGVIALLVANQTNEAQASMQTKQFKAEQSRLLRDLRKPIYEKYESDLQNFVTTVTIRVECEAKATKDCERTEDQLQHARYELQGSLNSMSVYGSRKARSLLKEIGSVLPRTDVGFAGEPVASTIDRTSYRPLYAEFIDQMCVDLSPSPKSCE